MSKEIANLLGKYLHSTLSEEEIISLKRLLADMDDETIENNLFSIWETYEQMDKRDHDAFLSISQNLRQLLHPSKLRINYRFLMRIAGIFILSLLFASVVHYFTKQQSYQTFTAFNYSVVTENGERASVVLPDGTKVSLNSGTTLTYPASFGKIDRKVRLKGEAYFEVIHDNSLPFIVETEKIYIKVLGTIFNVFAYSEYDWFETSLIEGSVELSTINGSQVVLLEPNQKARYSYHNEKFEVSESDLRLETAWKRGDLMFRSESIQNVFHQIDVFYGSTIEIEGSCPTKLFTGTFHETDINQVLNNLQIHYNFNYQKIGNHIHIKFNE